MSRKTFLYIRVSTLDQAQGAESQARALNEWCTRNNIIDFETFTDHGVSGAKESRPALDKMMERVKNHEPNKSSFSHSAVSQDRPCICLKAYRSLRTAKLVLSALLSRSIRIPVWGSPCSRFWARWLNLSVQ